MEKRDKIIIILGPTSSGKSDVAIRLAQKYNGEIISADSRQVYRSLDIGTGKVTGGQSPVILSGGLTSVEPKSKNLVAKKVFISEGIPHYLIDNASPMTNYNAAKFKKDANKIINDILKRGKLPIICGGTGFWIKSIVDDVNYPEVKPDWELRNKLRNYSAEKLFGMLKKLDRERTKTIDAKNKVRLIRAIEICKSIGKVPNAGAVHEPPIYNFLQIGIKLPKEKLHQNIKKRLKKRFDLGMIKEVEKLHYEDKLSWKKIESFGLGYFWIPKYLKGELKSKEELFEKIYRAEKNYAKRQMTWFKKDKRIKWPGNYSKILNTVVKFLQ